jgi:hypothetical protein
MSGAIPPLPSTPSWRGAQLKVCHTSGTASSCIYRTDEQKTLKLLQMTLLLIARTKQEECINYST